MNDMFTPKLHAKVTPKSLRAKSLKTLGPKIWNQLPGDIKSKTSYSKFKEYIDTLFGPKCRCNVYMNI